MSPAAELRPPVRPEAIVLGLGGNRGDRLAFLRRGLRGLAGHPEIEITRVSGVWESEYVGAGSQAPYLNAVCLGRTELAPGALLAVAKALEERLGRAPGGHLRPRTIDVDILLYGARRLDGPRLALPHPRLGERGFVLAPLAEIAPELVLPDSGETAAAAWARIRSTGGPWLRPWPETLVDPARPSDGDEEEWRAAVAVHRR